MSDTPTPDGQSWPPQPGQPPAGGYGADPTPPSYGQPPAYGGEPPAYGAAPPAYGAAPPAYSAPAYGQPAAGAYGQPGYGYGTPKQPNDGMAVAALVVGISGLVFSIFCFLLFGIAIIPCAVALVLGILARKRIVESNGTLGGQGMALAGIITGGIGTAWSAIWVIYFIVVAI